jgi:hypothetical protein
MQTLSSARRTAMELASAVEWTATVLDAHLAAGANDPQGDFSTVGDEDFFKHDGLCLRLIR